MNSEQIFEINGKFKDSLRKVIVERRLKRKQPAGNVDIKRGYPIHPATTIQGAVYGNPSIGTKKKSKDPRDLSVEQIKRLYK